MHSTKIKNIIAGGEGLKVEFKRNFNNDTIVTINAFANTKGGIVIIGVDDHKKPIGVDVKKETLQNWLNEIRNKTHPSIIPDIEIFYLENKKIVSISVKEFPIKPVSVKGKYFKRHNNSNHQLSLQEISDLYLQTFNASWDNYLTSQYTIENISEKKVNHFIEQVNENKEIPINDDTFTVLKKFELVKDAGITNA